MLQYNYRFTLKRTLLNKLKQLAFFLYISDDFSSHEMEIVCIETDGGTFVIINFIFVPIAKLIVSLAHTIYGMCLEKKNINKLIKKTS